MTRIADDVCNDLYEADEMLVEKNESLSMPNSDGWQLILSVGWMIMEEMERRWRVRKRRLFL